MNLPRNVESELSTIKRMTGEYKDFLTVYKRGGGWEMDEFMQSLNRKITKLETILHEASN